MADGSYLSPYSDDDRIENDEILYRQVHPNFVDWSDTDDAGYPRIQKAAFQDYPEEEAARLGCPGPAMSVHISSVVRQTGREPSELIPNSSYGLAALRADEVRQHSQGIQCWPTDDDESHAVVFSKTKAKRTQGQQKRMREIAYWVVLPD